MDKIVVGNLKEDKKGCFSYSNFSHAYVMDNGLIVVTLKSGHVIYFKESFENFTKALSYSARDNNG